MATSCTCSQLLEALTEILVWFKHILFRRKGLGAAYNATMPSPEILVCLREDWLTSFNYVLCLAGRV